MPTKCLTRIFFDVSISSFGEHMIALFDFMRKVSDGIVKKGHKMRHKQEFHVLCVVRPLPRYDDPFRINLWVYSSQRSAQYWSDNTNKALRIHSIICLFNDTASIASYNAKNRRFRFVEKMDINGNLR